MMAIALAMCMMGEGGTRWSVEKAEAWGAKQPWLLGCNFTPSTAINQLEMWQADTFDPNTIDRELGWAAGVGMNTARVFLHDLAYGQDPEGFKKRLDEFLDLASKHGIRPLLVFFDDCWDPNPKVGKQPEPKPGIHNSGWVKSPSDLVAKDPKQWNRLEKYVKDVIRTHANDDRVLAWDLYNEPGNRGEGHKSEPLVRKVFEWARSVDPSQPLTVGAWGNELDPLLIELSDVTSFHSYSPAKDVEERVKWLKTFGRPIICTEWLARTQQNVLEVLEVLARYDVGAMNWGFVSGKTNTIYPWGSPGGGPEPDPWFHDLLRADGTPYRQAEIEAFRETAARMRGPNKD